MFKLAEIPARNLGPLSNEQIAALNNISAELAEGKNLLCIKRTRREKKVGDVFVLTLNGVVYYYGKILKSSIKNDKDNWINGCLQVSIFKEKTGQKTLDNFRGDYKNLIGGAPYILTSQYWSSGYFETIGNVPLTEEEINLDCGYYSRGSIREPWIFYTAEGDEMDHLPKFYTSRGVTTTVGVYWDLRAETIVDPSLLEMP